jgi:hypothetical protein
MNLRYSKEYLKKNREEMDYIRKTGFVNKNVYLQIWYYHSIRIEFDKPWLYYHIRDTAEFDTGCYTETRESKIINRYNILVFYKKLPHDMMRELKKMLI